MVESSFEWGGGGRAAESEVPFEEVGFEGGGVVVERGLRGKFGGFFEDAFESGGFGGHGCG